MYVAPTSSRQSFPNLPTFASGNPAGLAIFALRCTLRLVAATRLNRIAATLFLTLSLVMLAGCAKSPLEAYETVAIGHTTTSDTMVALSQAGQISPATFREYDKHARTVDAALLAWGAAILDEYRKPKETRNYARLESLAKVAMAAANG